MYTISADFFHIFQLKAVGNNVDDGPVATFTLTNSDVLHLRLRNDDHATYAHHKMVALSAIVGKWTQAYVKVVYNSGNAKGSIQVILKDQSSKTIYKTSGNNGVINYSTFWPQADFVRPKWGLYRKRSSLFQSADWILFQNIQIWKKQ